jgi:hypothetical protein
MSLLKYISSQNKLLLTAVAIPVFIVLFVFLGLFGFVPAGNFPTDATSEWQAVFLNNNQTYFGKLENVNFGYVKLTNVYYLRAGGNLQEGNANSGDNVSLVKLGGELHGPEDVMYIRKDSILFWENMKDTARVVQLIRSAH